MRPRQLVKLSLAFSAVLFFNHSALSAEGCSTTKFDEYQIPCYCSQQDLENSNPVGVFYSTSSQSCNACISEAKAKSGNSVDPVSCCPGSWCDSKHK